METARMAYYISVTLTLLLNYPLDIGALPTSTNKTIAASSLHMANRTTHVHQKRKTQLSYNTRMTNLVEKYTEWDNWVNSNAPDGSGDDYEPIDEVLKHSHLCSYPIKIECLTTTGSKADDIGQIITCDLCSGLQCVNYDQSDSKGCADYKVRLACLKLPTECLTPVSTVPPVPVVTTTMKLPQTPTVNTNHKLDIKDLDTLCQFEFWIYILIEFGSCLALVFIIWLCWFCLRSKNTKVSNRK